MTTSSYTLHGRPISTTGADTTGFTADRDYEGRIDAEQIAWLSRDLASLPPGTPIVVVSHIPLATAFDSYTSPLQPAPAHHKNSVANAWQVIPLFAGHNVLGVLQGHTHVNETVLWHGVPYITGGAVSGNWWHSTHLGTPEGFTVVTVADNRLTTRYETYGFRSIDPHNT